MAAEQLTIGNLAKATDTKVETIRYYERIGLLPAPARTRGNYRSYSPEQLDRLSFIRRARGLGFSLPQVRALLRALPEKTESGGIPLRGRIGFKIPTGREASMGWGSHIRRICVYA